MNWGDLLTKAGVVFSVVTSIWGAYYGRKAYLATTYPHCNIRLRIIGFWSNVDEPPHKIEVEIDNLHVQISMLRPQVTVYMSEPHSHIGLRPAAWLAKWFEYIKFEPLSIIEGADDATVTVQRDHESLEAFVVRHWPHFISPEVNLDHLTEGIFGREVTIPRHWFRIRQPGQTLRVRVTVRYKPGVAGGRWYKRTDTWRITPLPNKDREPDRVHHWDVTRDENRPIWLLINRRRAQLLGARLPPDMI